MEIKFSDGLREMAEEGRPKVVATIKAAVIDDVQCLPGGRDAAAASESWLEQWIDTALNLDLVLGADEEGGSFVVVRATIGEGAPLPVGSPQQFSNGDWRRMVEVASAMADDISGELTRDVVVVGSLVKLPTEITEEDFAATLEPFVALIAAAYLADLPAGDWAGMAVEDVIRKWKELVFSRIGEGCDLKRPPSGPSSGPFAPW